MTLVEDIEYKEDDVDEELEEQITAMAKYEDIFVYYEDIGYVNAPQNEVIKCCFSFSYVLPRIFNDTLDSEIKETITISAKNFSTSFIT